MLTGAVQLHQVLLLQNREPGLATAVLAGSFCERRAFTRAGTNEIGLELGHYAWHVRQRPVEGVGGVADRSPRLREKTVFVSSFVMSVAYPACSPPPLTACGTGAVGARSDSGAPPAGPTRRPSGGARR